MSDVVFFFFFLERYSLACCCGCNKYRSLQNTLALFLTPESEIVDFPIWSLTTFDSHAGPHSYLFLNQATLVHTLEPLDTAD